MAIHAGAAHDWPRVFAWLGLALIVDGLDGPLARAVETDRVLPRFSGVHLDLIVDYTTYCIAPAFIILESELLAPEWRPWAAGFVVITSLFHFIDRDSKTKDGFFVGFPAIWNVICLYLFVMGAGHTAALATIAIFGIGTFLPITWPHPFRAKAFRPLTIAVATLWLIAAAFAIAQGFASGEAVRWIFIVVAVYMIGFGALRTLLPERLMR